MGVATITPLTHMSAHLGGFMQGIILDILQRMKSASHSTISVQVYQGDETLVISTQVYQGDETSVISARESQGG